MPTITALEPQKKRTGRFNLYLDGQFAFCIDIDALVKNHLADNQHITPDQISKIIKETVLGNLINLSLRFLTQRPRSQKEITDYLAKKISQKESLKFSEARQSPLIDQVISKLKIYHYLDDLEFAKWWVAARTKSKPKGKMLIKLELGRKGIDPEIIDHVLARSPGQKDLAIAAVKKKITRWQSLPQLELKNKVYQYLRTRGFDYDTISEAFAFFTKKS